jgi:hypothetical protein
MYAGDPVTLAAVPFQSQLQFSITYNPLFRCYRWDPFTQAFSGVQGPFFYFQGAL